MEHVLKGSAETRDVYLDGIRLRPEHGGKVMNLSPVFDWGRDTAGSTQLAFAVIFALYGHPGKYRDFKETVVEVLPRDADFFVRFQLTEDEPAHARPRLVAGMGGWHILDFDDSSLGKVVRCKGSDRVFVVLKGRAGRIREMLGSGVLFSLFTKLSN